MDDVVNRKMDLGKLAVGYVRVSTVGQGESGISLEAQKAAIRTFAEHAGYTLVEIFEDVASGVGKKSFHSRKGLKNALDLAVRAGADLFVWDWDRLSRFAGFEDQLRTVLSDLDRVICVKKLNMMAEASRAAIHAHDERVAGEISRATKKGMDRKRAEGAVFGNPEILTDAQPLGVAANSNNACEHVRRIADVLRGLDDPFAPTYAQVARLLNEKGLRTLHGKEWTVSRSRIPVKRAREIIRNDEEDALQSLPTYGMV
ncbi:recombinase family protein [Leisingera sp. JC11]|uniref:recombinase family protein n=1 Tax=Leisingera sp. JC11 TaxID=3042469 RepID=UPI003453D7E3